MENDKLTWFITGAGSGLGNALARRVLQSGGMVVATARDVRSLDSLRAEFPDHCHAEQMDVTNAAHCQEILGRHILDHGIDVLACVAGAAVLGAMEDQTEAEAMRQMDLNYLSPLRLTRIILPHFRKRRSGHLLFFSAAAAMGNYPGFSHYGAAKAALEAACESLKAELAPFQIGITLVQPGPFRTSFIERSVERVHNRTGAYEPTVSAFDTLLQRINGRQPGDPEKAAAVIHEAIVSGSAPFRLPLGKYMIKKLRDHATARLRDTDALEARAASADF